MNILHDNEIVMLITMLLSGNMAAEMLSLKLMDLEKVSAGLQENQIKRIDGYNYPAEQTTHGIGYGHHLHPFYYKGKTNAYDCALQGEWHPIVPGPELDFGVNEDNLIRKQPLLNGKYNTPFPWKDMLYNYEFLAPNARAYSFNNYYPQQSQQQLSSEDHQHRSDNITTKSTSVPNNEITTYLTPPPLSINTNWRNTFNIPQENNNPTKMMDLITALHNFKIIPLLEEEEDDVL